jgi:hypothetical protein
MNETGEYIKGNRDIIVGFFTRRNEVTIKIDIDF